MSMMQVIDTGATRPEKNMAYDAHLLDVMRPSDRPILHLYDWSVPSITYGYFTKVENQFNLEGIKESGLFIAKRPTGGGALFHTVDLAFSFLIPANHKGCHENVLDNYRYINTIVKDAVLSLIKEEGILLPDEIQDAPTETERFCMAKPTKYDVMVNGKKLIGAAQRKKKQGYLHQGSIAIMLPEDELLRAVLKHPDVVVSSMEKTTFQLLPRDASANDLKEMREKLKRKLAEHVQ